MGCVSGKAKRPPELKPASSTKPKKSKVSNSTSIKIAPINANSINSIYQTETAKLHSSMAIQSSQPGKSRKTVPSLKLEATEVSIKDKSQQKNDAVSPSARQKSIKEKGASSRDQVKTCDIFDFKEFDDISFPMASCIMAEAKVAELRYDVPNPSVKTARSVCSKSKLSNLSDLNQISTSKKLPSSDKKLAKPDKKLVKLEKKLADKPVKKPAIRDKITGQS